MRIAGEASNGDEASRGGSVRETGKKRKRNQRSLCQRLIDDLESTNTKSKPTSGSQATILSTPAEIRLQILLATKGDCDLLRADLRRDGDDLSAVCRTFREDMAWVSEQWAKRCEELSRDQRSAFSSIIDDLVGAASIDRRRLLRASPLDSQRNTTKSAAAAQDKQSEEVSGTIPFTAMNKWRKQRLKEATRERQARKKGSSEWRPLRRKALLEKQTMKFDHLSFLPPEERGRQGRAGFTRKQANLGETGTFVEGDYRQGISGMQNGLRRGRKCGRMRSGT